MPLISVIVPVYKVEIYLHRCVDSILGQTFTDFELILVDDGSPDGCPAICDEYAKRDRRVHVIHQSNGGLSAARNAGIDWAFAHSDSQWLTFVDSDDWLHSRYLETLHYATVSQNTVVGMCRMKKSTDMEPEASSIPGAILIDPEDVWVTEPIPMVAWGKVYKKNCFDTIRYPVGLLHEDEFVTHRLLFAQETISLIPAELYFYFKNSLGIMNAPWTAKRMVVLDAQEGQIQFFKKGGYLRAYQKTCTDYVRTIASFFGCASEKEDPSALELVRKLRRAMWRYHRSFQVPPHTREWLWGICYPKTVRLWSVLRRIFLYKHHTE